MKKLLTGAILGAAGAALVIAVKDVIEKKVAEAAEAVEDELARCDEDDYEDESENSTCPFCEDAEEELDDDDIMVRAMNINACDACDKRGTDECDVPKEVFAVVDGIRESVEKFEHAADNAEKESAKKAEEKSETSEEKNDVADFMDKTSKVKETVDKAADNDVADTIKAAADVKEAVHSSTDVDAENLPDPEPEDEEM